MAKYYEGVLGPFVGKLGPAVGYLWRGRAVMRAHVAHIRFPNTEAQLIERDWFVGMVRFAAAARGVLRHGLKGAAERHAMSEANYFVMSNKRHFSQEGGVAYERLQFSSGPVAPVSGVSCRLEGTGVLHASWERHGTRGRSKGDDRVYLYVYHTVERRGVVAEGRRRECRLAVQLPDGWRADAVHCYLFATSRHGEASPTAYAAVVQEDMVIVAGAPAADSGIGESGERPGESGERQGEVRQEKKHPDGCSGWSVGDSNSRPLPCEGSALNQLS